jgi:hypothetical protein
MMAFGRAVFANGNGIPDQAAMIVLEYCVSNTQPMNIKLLHSGASWDLNLWTLAMQMPRLTVIRVSGIITIAATEWQSYPPPPAGCGPERIGHERQ